MGQFIIVFPTLGDLHRESSALPPAPKKTVVLSYSNLETVILPVTSFDPRASFPDMWFSFPKHPLTSSVPEVYGLPRSPSDVFSNARLPNYKICSTLDEVMNETRIWKQSASAGALLPYVLFLVHGILPTQNFKVTAILKIFTVNVSPPDECIDEIWPKYLFHFQRDRTQSFGGKLASGVLDPWLRHRSGTQ